MSKSGSDTGTVGEGRYLGHCENTIKQYEHKPDDARLMRERERNSNSRKGLREREKKRGRGRDQREKR